MSSNDNTNKDNNNLVNKNQVTNEDHHPNDSYYSHKLGLLGAITIIILLVVGIIVAIRPNNTKTTTASSTSEAIVLIQNNSFIPATIKVKVGEPVVWINKDQAEHTVSSDPYPSDNGVAGFKDDQVLNYNDQYQFTFTKPGTYTYHDDKNPFSLRGTVEVVQ